MRSIKRWVATCFTTGLLLASAACSLSTEPGETVVNLEVAEYTSPCVGSFPTQCLNVRERDDAAFTYFYNYISGFTYEPGYRYRLVVGVTTVKNPPADGSSLSYRLINVVSKVAVAR